MSDDTGATARPLSYDDALRTMLADVVPVGVERVSILDGAGRALGSSIASPIALPPWDNAGMDGYAVRRADASGASQDAPKMLRVCGTSTAGTAASSLPQVEAGTAVRIMTGAPMPTGADAVVRIEDTDGGTDVVVITNSRDLEGRGNVRAAGEEIRRGDLLFAPGQTIGASHIGVMASIGCTDVEVFRKPRVTMLSGGDELVLLDRFSEVLSGDRIVASSTYSLPVLLRAAGADVTVAPLVADTLDATVAAIREAVSGGCDMLITTGGVSVGAHDYTKAAVTQVGGQVDFWRARIRPGGPMGFGHIGSVLWLGLPGNPVSTMVTGTVFAWPVLRTLGGHTHATHRAMTVTFRDHYETPAPLTYFLRVVLERRDDGGYDAHLAGRQGSNLLRTMSDAEALMLVPEVFAGATPGDTFDALLLP